MRRNGKEKQKNTKKIQLGIKAGLESYDLESKDQAKRETPTTNQRNSSEASLSCEKKVEDPKGPGPFFYIGGSNGAQLVTTYCMSKGWQRIQDSKRVDYKLKWCETKSAATYYSFREGEQLLYQIPNNKVLTTKIGLLSSLRDYERVMQKIRRTWNPWVMKMDEFFPETFRLDVKEERETFFTSYEEGQVWICKPTGLNQGRGIYLLKSQEQVDALQCQLQALSERKPSCRSPQARIVQRYIPNPLLLDGKKFDVRSYLLIASTVPYFVFFSHGYVRLTCNHYDPKSDDLTGHLTNQYMQKKNPLYSELKEETVWGMERFNIYVNEHFAATKGLSQDWVMNIFTKRMQQIMIHCFLTVKSKLDCRLGYFDLIGCDFLIDEDFKVWLLEMNCNPALHTNCEVLKEVIPGVVNETLDLALEIFNKSQKSQPILPLNTQNQFVLLYNGEQKSPAVKFTRSRSTSPSKVQRVQSESCQELQKTGKTVPRKIPAPSDNRNVIVAKPTTSKITQRTPLALSPIHMGEIPSGFTSSAIKHKTKTEPTNGSFYILQNNDVTSEAGKTKKQTRTPVVKIAFSRHQRLHILGNKSPHYNKKGACVPVENCSSLLDSSLKSQMFDISPLPENDDPKGLVLQQTSNMEKENAETQKE
ncbi:inactive polyglycylase TTLL10 [Rhinophrynus dorsalis]